MEHLSSMPTVVRLRGRTVVYGTPGSRVSQIPLQDVDILNAPVLGYPRTQDDFVDGPWGIRYRKIDKVRKEDHWMDMLSLRKLVQETEEWVAGQVQDGGLDAAMVRGSSVPLFRILDTKKVLKESSFLPKDKTTKNAPARSKKDQWDRE